MENDVGTASVAETPFEKGTLPILKGVHHLKIAKSVPLPSPT